MVEAILSYVIKAIDESSSVMDRIKGSVGLLGSSLSGLGGGFTQVGNIMTGFAAGGVAGAAITALGEVTKGLQDCIKEAGTSEAIFTDLGAAVERSGIAWGTVADGTKKALLAMQATTTYSDEQLAGALNRMLTFGLSYDQAMKALAATIDFAAAKHMDLESAATLVGKAVDGNTAIMKRYGIDITVAKDATDKFTPVLTALNDQFEGAAQAAASTYVGLQERLKNATQEVGEKIGTIMLPALASVTEAMLPYVDNLGKAVDATSAWLTEVGKMPEVQGAIKFVQDAFAGLMTYMQGLWGFMVDQFSPVLTELVGAFKDLWDALTPIGEAIDEIRAAFGDTGDIDLFKLLIMTIVVQIRAVATIIKEVAPYIKQFADMFKEAADFIAPILTEVVTGIRFFIDTLKTIFQDFYNWLIGRSLWTDLWTAVQRVTTETISALLSAIRDNFLAALRTAFDTVTTAMQMAWQNAWTAMQTTFTTISEAVGKAWTDWTASMQNTMTSFWTNVQTATTTALTTMQGYFTGAMAAIQGILNGAILAMQGAWQSFASFMSGAIATFQGAISGAASLLTSTLGSMQAAASSALGTIQGILSNAWNAITGAVTSAVTAASTIIAPASSASTLAAVAASAATAPAYSPQYERPTIAVTTSTPPPSPTTLNATVPVTVQIDSQTVSKVVQKSVVTSTDYLGRR